GVSTRSQIFGDSDYVYIVDINLEGTPTATKVLRAHAGVSVEVPDFAALYQRRLRAAGRTLLVSETDPQGGVVLRHYDILTGKDLWKTSFPANSVVLRSEQTDLAGAVEPDGKVSVFDLRTKKQVLKATVQPKHVDKAQGVTLLQDPYRYYLAINGPADPQANPWGPPASNLL